MYDALKFAADVNGTSAGKRYSIDFFKSEGQLPFPSPSLLRGDDIPTMTEAEITAKKRRLDRRKGPSPPKSEINAENGSNEPEKGDCDGDTNDVEAETEAAGQEDDPCAGG